MSRSRPLARRLARGALGALALGALGGLCAGFTSEGEAGAKPPAPPPGAGRAAALIGEARGRFHGVLPPDAPASPGPLEHRLPERAGAMRVSDRASGLWVEAELEGAKPARGERSGSLMVYEGAAGPGAHLFAHASGESVEDFVLLPERPPSPELSFLLSLSPRVAGLRLVSGSLELLDDGGAPRLRVARPYLVDASGARREASLALDGCAADRSPEPPWGRPTTPPGASRCTLRVRWDDQNVPYPALVDPAWVTTAMMAGPRAFHTQSLLPSGKILITGGAPKLGDPPLATAELFDPDTKTWSPVGAMMTEARMAHTATVLPSGKVLLAGGLGAGGASLSSTELFDGAAFAPLPSLGAARAFHAAVALPSSGRVLVLGGLDGATALSSVEVFDPLSGKWNGGGPMKKARSHHGAVVLEGGLASGRVLVAGGQSGGGAVKEAELFDPDAPVLSEAWASAGSPSASRLFASLTPVAQGQALLAGGCLQPAAADPLSCASPAADVERFVPPASWVSTKNQLQQARWGHAAIRARDEAVFFAGGQVAPTSVAKTVERFDPVSGFISKYDFALSSPRRSASAGLTRWGAVVVAGGITEGAQVASATADLLPLSKDGATCTDGAQCGSGRCVEGVCCDSDCNDPCRTCRADPAVPGSQDGVCRPAKAGDNPGGRCVDQQPASCGTKPACDAAGKCATYVGEACGEAYCSDGKIQQPTCQASGVSACKAQLSASCAPYTLCETGATCATSCTQTSQCVAGYTCKSGHCSPVEGVGTACMKDDECQSGHCVDGICCTSSCDQACESCLAALKADGSQDGICGPAKAGADPHERCLDRCEQNVFFSSTCSGASSGKQACVDKKTDCSPAHCDPLTGCGPKACTKNEDCGAGAGCLSSGLCATLLSKGLPCQASEECKEGLACADGVCCDGPCDGQCVACAAKNKQSGLDSGSCGPAKQGTNPGDRCASDGTTCGLTGLCDAKGLCAFGLANTPCSEDSCSAAGTAVVHHSCDGAGTCVDHPAGCQPGFACGGGKCLQSCTSNADCASGFSCNEKQQCISNGCISSTRYRTPSGENDCLSGRLCIEGEPSACASRPCQSSADCLPDSGLVCRLDGTCASPLSEPSSEPGCGCRLPGSPPPAGPSAPLALLTLALAARLRRPRR